MTELLLLQIILGILLWANGLVALGGVLQIAHLNPCPTHHKIVKMIGYIIIFILVFFIWPIRILKNH